MIVPTTTLGHDPPARVDPVDHALLTLAIERAAAQRRQEMLDAALRTIEREYGPTLFIEKIIWAVKRHQRNLPPDRVLLPATMRDIRRAFAKLDADPTLSR